MPAGVLMGAWRVVSGMAPVSLGSQPRPALMSSWHRALQSHRYLGVFPSYAVQKEIEIAPISSQASC